MTARSGSPRWTSCCASARGRWVLTPSDPAPSPVAPLPRQLLLDDGSLTGHRWTDAYTAAVDRWLAALYDRACGGRPGAGIALVAVGGYGRGELAPLSDLDLLLVHDGRHKAEVAKVAEALWYPIWDEGLKLGHSVRSVGEALSLAGEDLDTATSLLDVRHLGGDTSVSAEVADKAAAKWRKDSRRWLAELDASVQARHRQAGEIAYRLEPDLKEGRGGLRDVHALHWARRAGEQLLLGDDQRLERAYAVLLDARVELHRRSGRANEVLLLEEQDAVAAALGQADADVLMAGVSAAGRNIAWVSDETWFQIGRSLESRRRRKEPPPVEVAPGVLLAGGEITFAAGADVEHDPLLLLQAAVAAAEAEAPLHRDTLTRLQVSRARLPEPWPDEARDLLVRFLAAGPQFIPVVEALDQFDLWVRLIPEWAPNRCRPQRNAYHRFTVDRHLWEAAANAAPLSVTTPRPDLLLVGSLLHDVGKGYPGDHTDVGIDLLRVIGPRMGFGDADVEVLVDMVRHHLLLSEVATRRDLDDDATITGVAEAVKDPVRLHLLAGLTQADSLATGSSAWGSWKAYLVYELVRRVDFVLAGGDVDEVAGGDLPTPEQQALLDAGDLVVDGSGNKLVVVSADRPGLFSRVTGVLALHGLDVVAAGAYSNDAGIALEEFRVSSRLTKEIDWDKIGTDIERAIAGKLAVRARLADRARTYAAAARRAFGGPGPVQPRIDVDNDGSAAATVLEVHAPDGLGLLYRITLALAGLDIDIRRAMVQTQGENVVDVFYITDSAGEKVLDPEHLREIERSVLHAIASQ